VFYKNGDGFLDFANVVVNIIHLIITTKAGRYSLLCVDNIVMIREDIDSISALKACLQRKSHTNNWKV